MAFTLLGVVISIITFKTGILLPPKSMLILDRSIVSFLYILVILEEIVKFDVFEDTPSSLDKSIPSLDSPNAISAQEG